LSAVSGQASKAALRGQIDASTNRAEPLFARRVLTRYAMREGGFEMSSEERGK
jgi:hypothetical protein